MSESISVKPGKDRLIYVLEMVARGDLKIPVFQRGFVWTETEMLDLFDSIKNGYPIGSLLFWKPKESFKCYDTFGPYTTPDSTSDVKYLLDGFQRLSTLYGVLTNPIKHNKVYNQGDMVKFSIYYDLINEEFTYSKRKKVEIQLIPIYILIDTIEFLNYMDILRAEIKPKENADLLINKARSLAQRFIDYEFPYIDIRGGDIISAVEIFSRINSTGLTISTDWMVSALSYNPNENFHFIDTLNHFLREVEVYNFENLSRETILHCIEATTNKSYFDVKIEDLARQSSFPKMVITTLENIKKAIEFLNQEIHVVDVKLVPYNLQVLFLCEFFRLNPEPSLLQKSILTKWFWVTSYTNYFTVYATISKQRLALDVFRKFARGEVQEPLFSLDTAKPLSINPFPDKIDLGSVRSKALVLFMLNRIFDNSIITTSSKQHNIEIRYLGNERMTKNTVISATGLSCSFVNLLDNDVRKNDATQLLSDPEINYPEYFISEEVVRNNDIEEALNIRLRLIKDLERLFVESIGLAYS